MAAVQEPSKLLSSAQFARTSKNGDPGNQYKGKPRFSGDPGDSKTMHIAKGRLPNAPGVHPHHRRAGRRVRRAR